MLDGRSLALAAYTLLAVGFGSNHAQETTVDKHQRDESVLSSQVDLLNDVSFRVRQLARWRLEQQPERTLDIISNRIGQVDHNAGAQLVDLLTVFATSNDVATSLQAMGILRDASAQLTSVGRLADNSLHAIADLQEEQAMEVLLHHGAYIGPQRFSMNSQVANGIDLSLHIGAGFTGDDRAIQWIPFLKSIETVFLEGPDIDSRVFRAVAHLKEVRNLKLQHVTLREADLRLFRHFSNIRHLGINYVDTDDSIIPILAELPLSESLRLFGTKITQRGAEQVRKQLDGIDVYCGRGGFLGVGTNPSNTIVSSVTSDSGAFTAGIKQFDKLTHVNGEEIKTFEDLRTQLGKYAAGEKVDIRLLRGKSPLEFVVELTEQRSY